MAIDTKPSTIRTRTPNMRAAAALLIGLFSTTTPHAQLPVIDKIKLPPGITIKPVDKRTPRTPPKGVDAPIPPLPLGEIKLPPRFKIELFSRGVANARTLAVGSEGTVFVGTRSAGKVYALPDKNGDGKADSVLTIASGLNAPNGVAFHDGALYVAETHRITRYANIEAQLDKPPRAEVVYDRLPSLPRQGQHAIHFGPDGQLYISIGSACEVCDRPRQGVISRLDLERGRLKPYAFGVHNSIGFDWHPESGVLWFVDNGRDWLEGGPSQDELNRAPIAGLHFGAPYCYGNNRADPDAGPARSCSNYTAASVVLGANVSPLGMRFHRSDQFPSSYRNRLYVAQHGSWNRTPKSGFKIWMATITKGRKQNEEVFAEGWLRSDQTVWGRPVDIATAKDGAMLVSDDLAGVIYRISYSR